MSWSVRTVIIIVAMLALSGCSRTWEDEPPSAAAGGMGLRPDGTVAEGPAATASVSRAPAANNTGSVAPFGYSGEPAAYEFLNGYRVGAGDRLNIRVAGERDLTGPYNVDPAGNISVPLIGLVRVAGLSTPHIAQVLTTRLRQGYLRDPKVSVEVANLRPFYILGEVNRAGGIPYQAGMTVQKAVALAGGYSPRADQGSVLLTRRTAKGTRTSRVPVTTQVYPGDIVFVRERWF